MRRAVRLTVRRHGKRGTPVLASGSLVRLLVSVAFVSLGVAAVPGLALATDLQRPPPIILTTKTDTQRAVQEGFCVLWPPHDGVTSGGGTCAYTDDLLPRRLSVVRRGALVTISFRGATSVTDAEAAVRVLGRERYIRSFPLTGPKTRWRVRLRPGKYEVEVFGRFETADGHYGSTSGSLGLHVRRAKPPPPLAGRALVQRLG
jgi:hypothetical protein